MGKRDIEHFVLIDVEQHCLVKAPENCQHVALSYIWGTKRFFHLARSNFEYLHQAGSLREQIPTPPANNPGRHQRCSLDWTTLPVG